MPPTNTTFSDALTKILIPVGAILIGAIPLFIQNPALPRWAVAIMACYLVLIASFILFYPIKHVLARIRIWWTIWRLFQKYGTLDQPIQELQSLSSYDSIDTLRHLMYEMANWTEISRQINFDIEHFETLRSWMIVLGKRSPEVSAGQFLSQVREFSNLLYRYNHLFVSQHQQLEKLLSDNKLADQHRQSLKREWNSRREKHAAFVRKWESAFKNINEQVSAAECCSYFEQLPTLE